MNKSLFALAVAHGMAAHNTTPIMESANTPPPAPAPTPAEVKTNAILEAVATKAAQDDRSLAASLVTGWVRDGSPDAEDFDALAIGMAGLDDIDENTDLTDAQIDAYNDALSLLADAAVALGADQSDVTAMIDEDSDEAAERVYDAIPVSSDDDSDDAIAEYSVSDDAEDDAMFESSIKVVRNGIVKIIKKRLRPRRMSALQKASLKKARMKAHSASGNMARRKSMKLRLKRGL